MKVKNKNKNNKILILLVVFALAFMSVGFARYNKTINFNGTAIVKPDGDIYIKSVTLYSSTESAEADPFVTAQGGINFGLSFITNSNENTEYEAVFKIVIANDKFSDYVYNLQDYRPKVYKDGIEYTDIIEFNITGIERGEKIPSKTEKEITATFKFTNPSLTELGTYNIDGDFIPDLSEEKIARLMGTVDTTTVGDLRGTNELARFSMNVVSSYDTSKTFTIIADSEKYVTRNLNNTGTPEYEISANNPGQNFEFYLAKVDGAEYTSEREYVKILLVPTGETGSNTGRVTVLVDLTGEKDTEPPKISSVTPTIENAEGNISVSWIGTDNSGSIESYTIISYKSDGTKLEEITLSSSSESHTFTGYEEGSYYFIVYGTDSSGNTASSSDIANAQVGEGVASKSSNIEAKWNFTVRHTTDGHVTYTGGNTAKRGTAYTSRVTSNNTREYNNPTRDGITITMGGESYTSFLFSNNTITINPPITGDIVINVTTTLAGCLVEGTKILLASGKYKNIENIKYTDLLKVYDHVNGGTTDVYPIWIEKEATENRYRELIFSDGSSLKTIFNHSIFDVDKKKYINVANDEECKIGTRVYKWEDDKLKIVTIADIVDKIEQVKYYNVVSTNYYNIIANGFITTDTTASVANVYGFKENAIYSDNFYKCQTEAKLPYLFVSFLPHYLYKGLNIEHARAFLKCDLNIGLIKKFVGELTVEPLTRQNERYFMVSTSLDNINENNAEQYLRKEGSYYKLPENKAKYFIDTFSHKVYKPGQKIKVENSIHLKAIN